MLKMDTRLLSTHAAHGPLDGDGKFAAHQRHQQQRAVGKDDGAAAALPDVTRQVYL